MKALTVCQPYATLIARGDKPIENRIWRTDYRGPLAIHAGLSLEWMDLAEDYGFDPSDLPLGVIVAVVDVVACLSVTAPVSTWERWAALRTHAHANGPWCWVFERVRPLARPVKCRGAQGLWTVEAPIAAEVLRQVKEVA